MPPRQTSFFSADEFKSRKKPIRKGISREKQLPIVEAAAARLEALESLIDAAYIKHRSISRQEYAAFSQEIAKSWGEMGGDLVAKLRASRPLKGDSVLKSAIIDEAAMDSSALPTAGWDSFFSEAERAKRVQEVQIAMQRGVESVFACLSAGVARQIGPVARVVMLRNDDRRLVIEGDVRGAVCAYVPGRRIIYVSSACQSDQEIQVATAFATVQHVFLHSPKEIREKVNGLFLEVVRSDRDLKTEAYGEVAPYFESRSFWSKYQGVVPTQVRESGFQEVVMRQGGMHMVTVTFLTLLNGSPAHLGKILRDRKHRKTLLDSLLPFKAAVAGIGSEKGRF